ncbi:MAG: HD domain-containing protein [Oscillospiraceae bacterium]|jgi:predicted hydrolase (HD superfamily)|nr:HD domain-containing protein [Oscillospiraceae bacterium]
MIPTVREAQELLAKYNKEAFHLYHGTVVGEVLREFAREHAPGEEDFWQAVGLLHDIDFELFPNEHCLKGVELLRENGIDERIIHATMSHGYGIEQPSGLCLTEYKPIHIMEKILFAADELTGLIGAVAILRSSKSVVDLEVPSVKKKFKDKKFAAGCDRAVILRGAEELGWTIEELIERTIHAMRAAPSVQ